MESDQTSQLQVEAAVASTVGMVREINEDSYLVNAARRVFVVADGMGGHAAGEVASQIAIEKIAGELVSLQPAVTEPVQEILFQAVNTVHRAIRTASQDDSKLQGMGTTIVIAWFPTGLQTLWLAHVGDSRAYLLRQGTLQLLTEDHTLLNQALKLKKNAVELDFLPSRHLLSQALGASEFISPSVQSLEVAAGDLFLLCSDGLTDMLADEDVREIMTQPADLQTTCQRLVNEANHRGGRDNCTVVLFQVK